MDSKLLKANLRRILINENLIEQQALLMQVARELNVDGVLCAAALLYLLENNQSLSTDIPKPETVAYQQTNIKMVRYRLAVGSMHQVTVELLKQVLIEESGVDKRNINNINIQDSYTLIDLPDEMPLDIFQHLKTVEINQHKLDIKRVKNRHKHRNNNYFRRGRQNNKRITGNTVV